jgi:hypothetical protein
MLRLMLLFGMVSGAMYLTLVWLDVQRRRKMPAGSARPAYLWGLLFSGLFYYGFPLWWWRYGLRRALFIVIACICAVALILEILKFLDWITIDDQGTLMVLGLMFNMPVRAIAGMWVAKKDLAWRKSIVETRTQKLQQQLPPARPLAQRTLEQHPKRDR